MGEFRSSRKGLLLGASVFSILAPGVQAAITADQARVSYEAFRNTYWRAGNKTYYKYDNKTGELDYWMWAHAWEVEMDAYERTKAPAALQAIRDCYDGFVAKYGTDLKSRAYNDDIGWWVMAATRAYDLTGVTAYRDLAKKNFDWVYATQADNAYGGGIWWMNTSKRQKNSASTLPFSVAGFKLGRQLNDPSYTEKAKLLHAWTKLKLFRGWGEVADRIETVNGAETVIWGPLSYNHGTWISSAWEMFKATGDSTHFRDANAALDYFKNVLSNKATGILPDERGDGTGNTDNDAGQYKTVFVHYAMRFIIEAKQWQWLPWLNANAESLWKNRRADNLMYFAWATPTPTGAGKVGAQMASGGVALLNLIVLAEAIQSFYMEGVDTTDAQGNGLWNEFTVDANGISGGSNFLLPYTPTARLMAANRLFPHSFAEIQHVPIGPSWLPRIEGAPALNVPFLVRMDDSTYAKVALLMKRPDGRYAYRYGVSRVKGNLQMAEYDYSRTPRYKPNNFQVQPMTTLVDGTNGITATFQWEAPLASANTLTGYEVYVLDSTKADRNKPIDLAQWTMVGATADTKLSWKHTRDDINKFINIVAVYSNGKSAPLDAWYSIPNAKAPATGIPGVPKARTGEIPVTRFDSKGRLLPDSTSRNPGRSPSRWYSKWPR